MSLRWLQTLIVLCACAAPARPPAVDTSCLASFSDTSLVIDRDAYYHTYELVAVSLALLANDLPERRPSP